MSDIRKAINDQCRRNIAKAKFLKRIGAWHPYLDTLKKIQATEKKEG